MLLCIYFRRIEGELLEDKSLRRLVHSSFGITCARPVFGWSRQRDAELKAESVAQAPYESYDALSDDLSRICKFKNASDQ